MDTYKSTNLDVCAYLLAKRHMCLRTQKEGEYMAFVFPASAQKDAEAFAVPNEDQDAVLARNILENYRTLRTRIVEEERSRKAMWHRGK